jgi:hypothetical protein
MAGWEIAVYETETSSWENHPQAKIGIFNKTGLNTKGEWDIISGDRIRMIVK